MKKLVLILALTLTGVAFKCGGGSKPRPTPPRPIPTPLQPQPTPPVEMTPTPTPLPADLPTPEPSPSPTATATPSPTPQVPPVAAATPYPTPQVDIQKWIHKQGGRKVEVKITAPQDVGTAINKADAELGDEPGEIIVRGGGSSTTQITISHDLTCEGIYSLEAQVNAKGEPFIGGQILTKSDVMVEGIGSGCTMLGPNHVEPDGYPAVTIFQNYDGSIDNGAASKNITIKNITMLGRQEDPNRSGVRQTTSFGNCANCALIDSIIDGHASIGVQAGGNSSKGNHSSNVLMTGNKIGRNGAAHIALVNTDGAFIFNNQITKIGRKGGIGGVSGIDIETNSGGDKCENLKLYNNFISFEGSEFLHNSGNGINAQNPYESTGVGLLMVNNTITGGPPTLLNLSMSSGIFFTGSFAGAIVSNNSVENARHSCLQLYGTRDVTFEYNECNATGSGGIPAIVMIGASNNKLRFNNIHRPEGLSIQVEPILIGVSNDSINNIFEGNTAPVGRFPSGLRKQK